MTANYWITLGLPSILFAIAFLGMIWGFFKDYYKKRIWILVFVILMLGFIFTINANRYLAVVLVRAGRVDVLNGINLVLDLALYVLGAIALIIFYFNRNQWAALPIIQVLTFSAVTRYSVWFVNLTIWYAQAYF